MRLSEDLQKVYENSIQIYSKAEVEVALDRMAVAIGEQLGDKNPIVLSVLLGGIVPLGNLLTRLDFQLELDYVHVSSYGVENRPGELIWKAKPTIDMAGRTVLIMDDILDAGVTLQRIKEYCYRQQAQEVYTAVLLDKRATRRADGLTSADFHALRVDDLYVFGYGLDYSKYLRNLPGIYAFDPNSLTVAEDRH